MAQNKGSTKAFLWEEGGPLVVEGAFVYFNLAESPSVFCYAKSSSLSEGAFFIIELRQCHNKGSTKAFIREEGGPLAVEGAFVYFNLAESPSVFCNAKSSSLSDMSFFLSVDSPPRSCSDCAVRFRFAPLRMTAAGGNLSLRVKCE